jgi:hypothetical protein
VSRLADSRRRQAQQERAGGLAGELGGMALREGAASSSAPQLPEHRTSNTFNLHIKASLLGGALLLNAPLTHAWQRA